MRGDAPALGLVTQVGLTIALSIVGGLLLGLWIDSTLGTRPFGMVILLLLGILVGSVAVYRMMAAALAASAQARKASKNHQPPMDP